MKWETQNGESILIEDMDNNHLLNTVKFIERNSEEYVNQTQDFYLFCYPPNGEMAQDCFEREFDEVMEMSKEDILEKNKYYQKMLNEIEKRGLTPPTKP